MNLTKMIPPDELLLAQLASAKLAKLVQGILSVGLGSLELENSTGFLVDKGKVLSAFIGVLHCIGVKPGPVDAYESLRQGSSQLSDLALQFHGCFMSLCHWRNLSPEEVRASADSLLAYYGEFCRSLGAFRALLGAEMDSSEQVHQASELIAGFLESHFAVAAH